MKNVAFDIYEDTENRKYSLVKVEYDIVSGEAKVVSVEHIADSKPVAIYRAQQEIAKKMFNIKS